MSVGIGITGDFFEIGSSDLLHAFFSTISYNLENEGRGSKYPVLLNKLYYHMIYPEESKLALEELKDIMANFSEYKSNDIVWDIDDLSKKVPEDFHNNLQSNELIKCFVTVNGRDIFEMLYDLLDNSSKKKVNLEIITFNKFMQNLFGP